MSKMTPERAFKLAVTRFPSTYTDESDRHGVRIWGMVDAYQASDENDTYYGKLVLAEWKEKDNFPTLHFRFMLDKRDLPAPTATFERH